MIHEKQSIIVAASKWLKLLHAFKLQFEVMLASNQ
jgi:hypothetical protein